MKIKVNDETETDLVNLRRTIPNSNVDSRFRRSRPQATEDQRNPGRQEEVQLCIIIIECCIQNKAYLPYILRSISSTILHDQQNPLPKLRKMLRPSLLYGPPP